MLTGRASRAIFVSVSSVIVARDAHAQGRCIRADGTPACNTDAKDLPKLDGLRVHRRS